MFALSRHKEEQGEKTDKTMPGKTGTLPLMLQMEISVWHIFVRSTRPDVTIFFDGCQQLGHP